jgi:hypothetical protein
MKFIIYAPLEINDCGGCTALYNLAQILIDWGYDAYVFSWDLQISSLLDTSVLINNIPIATHDIIDIENDIVIYPEIIEGNPLGIKKCVRWILYYLNPTDFSSTWGENDLWVYWSAEYITKNRDLDEQIMNIYHLNKKWVRDNSIKDRTEEFYIIRKGRNRYSETNKIHSNESILLEDICKTQKDYISYYQKGRILYSYDPHTFHLIISALCGCVSVVQPMDGVSRNEWSKHLPGHQFLPEIDGSTFWPGIAYGIDDLELASSTIDLLPLVFKKQSEASVNTVRNFLEKVHSHFKI